MYYNSFQAAFLSSWQQSNHTLASFAFIRLINRRLYVFLPFSLKLPIAKILNWSGLNFSKNVIGTPITPS